MQHGRLVVRCLVFHLCLMLTASPLTRAANSTSQSRWDVSVGPGLALQFAKIVNETFDVGPHAQLMVAWRVQDTSGLSLWLGYDFFQSTFGHLRSESDVRAQFFSVGVRFETRHDGSAVDPFLILGAGAGNAQPVSPDPFALASLRHTAVMFGVGSALRTSNRTALIPLIRVVTGAGSKLTIPVTLSLRYSL